MHIKNILWILPFISFMGGYFLIQSYFGKTTTLVPFLIGKQLNEAVCIVSQHMLVPRIIAEKEDCDLPVGTVIQQKPEPYTSIRSHQTIMLILSKLPDPLLVPLVVGKNIAEMMPVLLEMGLKPSVYEFESDEVLQGVCLAQWPSPHYKIKTGSKMILYSSKNKKKSYVVPDFRGKKIEYIQSVCEKHSLLCQVVHMELQAMEHVCRDCTAINQRPLPGTLITLDATKKMTFQFLV